MEEMCCYINNKLYKKSRFNQLLNLVKFGKKACLKKSKLSFIFLGGGEQCKYLTASDFYFSFLLLIQVPWVYLCISVYSHVNTHTCTHAYSLICTAKKLHVLMIGLNLEFTSKYRSKQYKYLPGEAIKNHRLHQLTISNLPQNFYNLNGKMQEHFVITRSSLKRTQYLWHLSIQSSIQKSKQRQKVHIYHSLFCNLPHVSNLHGKFISPVHQTQIAILFVSVEGHQERNN